MKVLHICLCGYYSDGWGYQDNLLADQNLKDGHEVYIIASQYRRSTGNNIEKVQEGNYVYGKGINITRIPFKFERLGSIKDKIRKYKYLFKSIERINPDVILVHGLQFYDLNIIRKYKEKYPHVKIYADNHATEHNSGKNVLSEKILHKLFYRKLIQKNKHIFEKIFYITPDSKKFLADMYDVTRNLEFMPLCGNTYTEEEILKKRSIILGEEKIAEDNLILMHAGKMNKDKKTLELLKVFSNNKNSKMKLFLVGVLAKDIEKEALDIIQRSKNIYFRGWKNSEELENYLCASDVLIQPGSQSVVFQQAIACGTAVILDNNINTQYLVKYNNGILLDNTDDLHEVISNQLNDIKNIGKLKSNSLLFAREELNYNKQSEKFLGQVIS